MDQRAEDQRSDPAATAPTIVLSPPGVTGPSAGHPTPRVAVVAGSGPHLSAETRSLLQVRLRAAAVILLTGFVLFFLRSLSVLILERDSFRIDSSLMAFHAALCLALGTAVARLSGPPLATRRLRAMELAIFGLVTAFFAALQYQTVLGSARRGDATMLLAASKSTLHFTLLLLWTYAMFIPNTWRGAARVVVPMAATPPLVTLLLLGHPEVGRVARRVATFALVSENGLMMTIGVALALYGTHVINALRREAFEARQLGQYRLRRLIGAGGMGVVHLAEHRLLKRPCAIKLIRPAAAGDPTALARFEREVRSAARLSHPHTIEIYDYGRAEDGTFYYAMEYLHGLSLAELVERHGPVPPGRAIYLLRPACEALAEAHWAGLIHRDIKPANLFAARRGGQYDFVKLLDFGLVKPTADPDAAELSRDGVITGSPLYMAPEQVGGARPPDGRSDLYALGGVAYYLLTGRAPFAGAGVLQVLIAHARDPVVPPSRLRPGVPEDLERVVLRCLAKDPADRFPDAVALERALAGCADAGAWDAEQAARWWREVEPGATAE